MTSIAIAIRTSGCRCVACNQRAAAWLCETCAFNSGYYAVGFHVDARSSTPTMVAKRGLYPAPHDGYRDMPVLPALTGPERLAVVRDRLLRQDADADPTDLPAPRERLKILKAEAKAYGDCARTVDARRARREQAAARTESHYNCVGESDPQRWCAECLYYRRHHPDCPLIATEGVYVGGYPDDGRRPALTRFAKLAPPSKHWGPTQHKQHRRAIARRWQAFVEMWGRIGLAYFTQMLKTRGQPLVPGKKASARISASAEVCSYCAHTHAVNTDGTVRKHKSRGSDERCPGSGSKAHRRIPQEVLEKIERAEAVPVAPAVMP